MVVVALYKISVCLAYLRLLGPAIVAMRRFVLSVLTLIIIGHLASTLVIILQCQPPRKGWQPWIDGSCLANYPTWNVRATPVPNLRTSDLITTQDIRHMMVFEHDWLT
jgi:hypothetical protein